METIEQRVKRKFNLLDMPEGELALAWCTKEKPKRFYTVRTGDGCLNKTESVVESGYRKVKNGIINFDGRRWTHPILSEIEGLYVKVWYLEWLQLNVGIFQGPTLTEIEI